MKKYAKLVLMSSLLVFSLPGCANTSHKKTHVNATEVSNQNLDQLVGGICRRADTGVLAQSLTTGKTLYTYKADTAFSPASNMKAITAFAALKYLGPEFRYHTQLLTDAVATNPANGVLMGNLYVKFDGDPSLQLQDLDIMVNRLSAAGIHTVTGHLVIDGSRYDGDGVSPGTVDTDRRFCYGAPVEAAIVNENCLSFRVAPAAHAGEPALLELPYGMKLPGLSSVSTSTSRHCHMVMAAGQDGDYHLDGCVFIQAKPFSLKVPVPKGSQLGEAAMVALLQRHHIAVLGDAHLPLNKNPLAVLVDIPSKPLSELVVQMMKHSDNLFANTLFKTLGARYSQQSGTWQNSATAVKAILQAAGIETASMVIIDGSGLSRKNLVSARQFVEVLRAAYQDPVISKVYFDALPVGGINGSLKNRLGFHDTIGKVHAKTGSMKGVSSLSGYLVSTSNDVIVFSILVNDDFQGSLFQYRSFEDKACRYLLSRY